MFLEGGDVELFQEAARYVATVQESSPNIFANLSLSDADNHFLKAQIIAELYRLTNERKLTQAKVGELIGISHFEVSQLFKAISANTPSIACKLFSIVFHNHQERRTEF